VNVQHDYHSPLSNFEPTELFDTLSTGIVVLDAQLCPIYANVSAQDFMAVSLRQARGRPFADLFYDPRQLVEVLRRSMSNLETCTQHELVLKAVGSAANREPSVIDLIVTPLEGQVTGTYLLLELSDATQRQRIAQERRREQGGCDGIHRHDDRAQHCRRPVLNGEVERAELDGLHEQTRDCDVAELAPRRPCRPDDERPGTQDDRGDTEPDDEDGHRRHRLHSHVADGVAQRVEEGDRRRSSGWHPGRRHGSMVSTPSRPVQRLLAIVTDRDSLSIRASLVEYLASAQRFDPFC